MLVDLGQAGKVGVSIEGGVSVNVRTDVGVVCVAVAVGGISVAGADVQAGNRTMTINRQQRFFPSFI